MKLPLSSTVFVLLIGLLSANLSAQDQSDKNTPGNQTLLQRWFKTQDKDGDQKISRAEATGQMKTNFARIDSNQDGFLERTELVALAERLSRNQRNNNNRPRQQGVSDEQLAKMAPEGVTVEANIAYRPR